MILSLMKKVILLLIFAVSLAACSNEDTLHTEDVAKQEKTVSFKVSEDDAKAELRNFLNNLHSTQATTRSTSQIEFADVQVVRNNAVTRAGSTSEGFDVGLDTLVYAINFANNQGFALVAADKRTSPILAIADEGSFSIENLSEDKDEGFLSFLDNALKMEVNDKKITIIHLRHAPQSPTVMLLALYTRQFYIQGGRSKAFMVDIALTG